MAKLLVVKGHPLTSEESFSLKGLDKFVEVYKAHNPQDEVVTLDVFKDDVPEIDEDLARATGAEFSSLTKTQQEKMTRFNELTDLFLESDKVVIANPLWNLHFPTRLKAWVDTINVAGKTFRYTAEGSVGLVKGKKVLHIQANGGVYNGSDYGSQYLRGVFNFIGVNDVESVYIEGHAYEPSKSEEILNNSLEKISDIAQKF
ncbi:FMN-dependent NADH-azoreductase [Pilibacter termitis]|uniref:FMN dependent NADH:quinone oxidoreductase n=1 Tax=Pilibacter termitis TaxID=263852 RepID=A0A1T4QFH3_9ENTE|nr:NAD(P)H-dependent oxidoreductase [Pilibacter termitis]SKA02479.1 FMN-dependent NADH-azoreductase [Pilibacter termitis]